MSVEGSHHVGRGFARESGASNKKRYTWSLGSQQRVQSRYKGKAHYVMYRSAKLHGDLFSRHASPLEVYVFVAVDERGEHALSDEICRRCNGKQQGRRRGGRSVQLPDWFMIQHSSRHVCTYAYVLVHDQIYSAREKERNTFKGNSS